MFDLLEGRDPRAASDVVRTLREAARALSGPDLDWLARLPLRRELPPDAAPHEGFGLVHGNPDPERPFAYLLSVPDARAAAPHLARDLTFFGHTHVPGGFVEGERGWRPASGRRSESRLAVPAGRRALLNPGSVARARDGGPDGCYLVWDDEERVATLRRTGAARPRVSSAP